MVHKTETKETKRTERRTKTRRTETRRRKHYEETEATVLLSVKITRRSWYVSILFQLFLSTPCYLSRSTASATELWKMLAC
jgi:hypothetical protein